MDGVADYVFVEVLGEVGHGTLYLAKTPPRLHVETPLVGVKVIAGASDEDSLRRATRELRAFAAVECRRTSSRCSTRAATATRSSTRWSTARAARSSRRTGHSHDRRGCVRSPRRPAGRMPCTAPASCTAASPPGTVLLADDGARLADLGLAQALHPSVSVTGLGPAGSVAYIDPAVLAGEVASPASDIWSLGATLHFALTGAGVHGDLPVHDPLLAVRRVLTQKLSPVARARWPGGRS